MNTVEHNGLTFRVTVKPCNDIGAPWEECDGHGSVRRIAGNGHKRAGERWLTRGLAYDIEAATEQAHRDGWGIPRKRAEELRREKGRDPTKREIAAEAVRLDFERMRGFANDEWGWVGVVVELLDVDGHPCEEESLWAIESDDAAHIEASARDLMADIAGRVGDADTLVTVHQLRRV